MPELVEALAPVIAPLTGKPYALFGHSMGALISFELCRYMRRNGLASPEALFVSGHRAPHLPDLDPPIHNLPTADFLLELRDLNGTASEVFEHEELLELAIPGLRADFQVCETYAFTAEAPLDVPIVAFGGLSDSDVGKQDIDGWRIHTSSQFKLGMLPGDHFFINSARTILLQRLSQELYGFIRPRAMGRFDSARSPVPAY